MSSVIGDATPMWSDRFAPHGPRIYSIYEKAVAEGNSEKVALEEFDDALERLERG